MKYVIVECACVVCVILDLSVADVGNYSCRIGGPQNKFAASITHQLSVTGMIDVSTLDSAVDGGGRALDEHLLARHLYMYLIATRLTHK